MTTVGIISEYNPFHKGHAYQIERIRAELGGDTRIVAVMSGHFPQRGDVAIADKFTRAAAAVASGVDLVLELPFPFSGESAPVFARAGMAILAAAHIDVLSFGSESGDIGALTEGAAAMEDPAFRELLYRDTRSTRDGFPKEASRRIAATFGEPIAALYRDPNNLLGMEYIRASRTYLPSLRFHTVKRIGSHHGDTALTALSSSSAIRTAVAAGDIAGALLALPESARPYYSRAYKDGLFPASLSRLSPAVLSHFCLNSPKSHPQIADAGGGLYRRLFKMAEKASDIDSLISLTATKRYTRSRIRRAIRNTFLGVTSSEIARAPLFTEILAFNAVGQGIIHDIKRYGEISLLTKPADAVLLPDGAREQAAALLRADSLFTLTLPKGTPRDAFLRRSPARITAKDGDNFSLSSFVEGIDKPRAE